MGKGRAPCCDKSKVKRGPWSPAEDLRLITFIQKHGHDNWRSLPKQAGLLRCGKSCRLRWINYLRPDVKRGNFTKEEEDTIIRLHQSLGNKWSKIASYLPGRTDNEIKNVWNTHLKKKVLGLKTNKDNESNKESSLTVSSSSTLSSSSTQFSHGQVSSESLDHHDHDHEMGHDDDVHHHTMPKNPSDHQDPSSQLFSEQELGNSTLLLEEVNKPDVIFSSVDHQIPLESDLEFWNMLGGVEPFCPNEVHQSNDVGANQSSEFGGHVYNNCNNNNNHNKELEVESSWNWIRYLESELGLDSTEEQDGIMVNNKENVSTVDNGVHHDDGQYQPSIPLESCEKMKIKSPEVDNMGLGYFHQVWPYQSPHRSSVF